MTPAPTPPKSTKRNKEWREEQARLGFSEVRGVFAQKADHDAIKAAVRALADSLSAKRAKAPK